MSVTPVDNYAALADKKSQLIRKANDGSAFLAEISADLIGDITGTGSKPNPLPADYFDLGLITTDGMQFSSDTSQSDITSFGQVSPTRSDITSATDTVTVTCQETKLQTIGLYTGSDWSSLVPDATTGELVIKKPSRPTSKFYRLFTIAVDDGDAGEIYICRFFPRAKVTSISDQALQSGDSAITWGVTFTGFVDEEYGAASSYLFGGPGFKDLLTDMGFA